MAHKEQIEELAHGVNNMLTLYLEVHNGIFAQPWWRSIPIPGLFKTIPFDRYEIQISKVEKILREIEGHEETLYEKATADEKTFLAALLQFTIALLKAVLALRPVVAGLKGKTDGKPYDMAKYNADVGTYQAAEKAYHALGEEMNRKWGVYQSGPTSLRQCEVHISDVLEGRRVEHWVIGEQVARETYEKFKDGSGRLYAWVVYEKGEPQISVVPKSVWDQFEQHFAAEDAELAALREKTLRGFGLK